MYGDKSGIELVLELVVLLVRQFTFPLKDAASLSNELTLATGERCDWRTELRRGKNS